MWRLGAIACAMAAVSCSAVLDFHECNVSADCAGRSPGGATLYCNVDHQCVDTWPCRVSTEATAAGTPLVIGGLYLLSQPMAGPNDHAIRQAVDLAVYELNQLVPVRHVACDTGGDLMVALQAFDLLTRQFGAVAVVGPNTSDEVIALAPEARARGVVVISPAASAAAISDLADDNLVWRTCASDDLQAKVLATLVPAPPTGSPLDVVWVKESLYAVGLQKAFIAASGRTDAKPIEFSTGMVTDAVSRMGSPAYAVLIADYDAPALVNVLKTAPGMTTTQYLMTDAALTPTLWGAAPYDFTFLTRIRGTAPALPALSDPSGPVYAAFQVSYRGHWNGEDPANTAFVANAYDAAYALAIAGAAAGPSQAGYGIEANLFRMSDHAGTIVKIGPGQFHAGVNALLGGGNIDLVGTSGPIDWDAKGDLITAPTEVWQIAQDTSGAPTFTVVRVVTP
jgi:branched-chain amino acid transport system substrate-binding protein